ncbi:MAG: type VI secretion system tip protein VgrG, partial [Proteobacteria bacterium]|nr:type VI secretion system tip protein VgrG [Pseudomonadota bacterium]
GETSFDFVCRLMEEEGIYYYFQHKESGEILILDDDSQNAETCPSEPISFSLTQTSDYFLNQVIDLDFQEQLRTKSYTLADYNPLQPSTQLLSIQEGEKGIGEIYDYPGKFEQTDEGDQLSNLRLQKLEWPQNILEARTTSPQLLPGYNFTLEKYPRSEVNQNYLVYSVKHKVSTTSAEEPLYQNTIMAIPSSSTFRPPSITPKPYIASHQTAVVVGKSGEEIWCDEYGRIKVQFFWDRRGKKDENSSCWIRVAQLWASSGWGGLFIPRIGMEVVVCFVDGDPDRPLVVGCVYNGDNMPPYAKDEPTKSTIKTQSSKEKQDGFNEIRFDDKKNEEQIYFHAQHNMDVEIENDLTETLTKGDHTYTIKKGDRNETLEKGDYTLTLKKGNRTTTIEGDDDTSIKKNLTLTVEKERDVTIKKSDTLTNKDDFTQNVDKDFTVSANNITFDAKTKFKISTQILEIEASEIKVKGEMTIKVEAGVGGIELKSTGSVKMEGTTGVEIKGTASVKIEGTGGVNINSVAPLNIKSTAPGVVDVGPAGTVKGVGMLTIDGGGMVKISGSGIVMIN